MDWKSRKILVTGAAIRVGAEIVKYFYQLGAEIFVHYRTHRSDIEIAKSEMPNLHFIQADFNINDEVKKVADLIKSEDINTLINNSSIYEHYNLAENSNEAVQKHLQINAAAPRILMEAIIDNAKRNQQKYDIINILDQVLLQKTIPQGAYFQSKAELMESTLEFAKNYGKLNCKVNAIAPGPMLAPDIIGNNRMEKTIPTLPLLRKVEIADLNYTIKFLIENNSITGAIIPLDCGQHLR